MKMNTYEGDEETCKCPYDQDMKDLQTMKTTQKILLGLLGLLVTMVGLTLHSAWATKDGAIDEGVRRR